MALAGGPAAERSCVRRPERCITTSAARANARPRRLEAPMSIAPFLPMQDHEAPEKDVPLREDIRLLGRILGDTVREQEGDEVFAIVEKIRQTSIRFHRDDDAPARQELEALLNDLPPERTVQIVRAFSYFSHLANI